MAFWSSLREQALALWNRWTIGQRAGFIAAALACIAAISGTLIWASQPEYIVIASQLTPSRSVEIAGY
jgi:flagellar biosynthesis/type III secretory pathway M-ring protein FliF/YscJ